MHSWSIRKTSSFPSTRLLVPKSTWYHWTTRQKQAKRKGPRGREYASPEPCSLIVGHIILVVEFVLLAVQLSKKGRWWRWLGRALAWARAELARHLARTCQLLATFLLDAFLHWLGHFLHVPAGTLDIGTADLFRCLSDAFESTAAVSEHIRRHVIEGKSGVI